jgi:hypothetical protein
VGGTCALVEPGARGMHGGGSRGEASEPPTGQSHASQIRLLARAATLIAELSTCVEALGASKLEPVVAAVGEPDVALSTRAAAHRLGIAPYTLNALARAGTIPARQDAPHGPRHFRPADLDAYEVRRTTGHLAGGVDSRYSRGHDDSRGRQGIAPPTQHDASRARGRSERLGDDGRPLGARCPTGDATRRRRPPEHSLPGRVGIQGDTRDDSRATARGGVHGAPPLRNDRATRRPDHSLHGQVGVQAPAAAAWATRPPWDDGDEEPEG